VTTWIGISAAVMLSAVAGVSFVIQQAVNADLLAGSDRRHGRASSAISGGRSVCWSLPWFCARRSQRWPTSIEAIGGHGRAASSEPSTSRSRSFWFLGSEQRSSSPSSSPEQMVASVAFDHFGCAWPIGAPDRPSSAHRGGIARSRCRADPILINHPSGFPAKKLALPASGEFGRAKAFDGWGKPTGLLAVNNRFRWQF
jgi:hypothetical protein